MPRLTWGGLSVRKTRREYPSFDCSLVVAAPPAHALDAFFDPKALSVWWQATRSVTTPRALGAYAVQWETTRHRDDILGVLGGTLHGVVAEYTPERELFLAGVYWLPPDGDAIGPMSIEVTCEPHAIPDEEEAGTLLRVAQHGYEESERWSRYYEVVTIGWQDSLECLKAYLEGWR